MSVIISGGRATTVASAKSYPLPLGYHQYQGPSAGVVDLLRGDNQTATYDFMYRSQPMVHSVVKKLVMAFVRLPVNFFEYNDAHTGRVAIHDTDLNDLFRRPFTRGSESKLKSAVGLSFLIHGHGLLVKYRKEGPGSPVTELWPVPWRYVQMISDNSGPIGYNVQINAAWTPLGPEDVVHFEMPGGVSPLEPLRRTLALEDAAMTWQGESFRNGITPRGAFTTEQKIQPASLPVLRAELEKLYAGPENAGRFGIFDNGLKFEAMGSSAVDAELLGQRKLSREEVCAVYDVSPPMIGLLENAKGLLVNELRQGLHDAIASHLVLMKETFETQLLDPDPWWRGTYMDFDTSGLTAADPETQARTFLMEQQSSTSSTNERRLRAGLPRIDTPDADKVFQPLNMVALGEAPALPADGSKPGGTPEQGQTDPAVTAGA